MEVLVTSARYAIVETESATKVVALVVDDRVKIPWDNGYTTLTKVASLYNLNNEVFAPHIAGYPNYLLSSEFEWSEPVFHSTNDRGIDLYSVYAIRVVQG